MPYLILGSLTYASQANRDSAKTSILAVLATYPQITGVTTGLTSGVNTPSTTVLTISMQVPDATTAELVRVSLIAAWSAMPRTTFYISEVKAK